MTRAGVIAATAGALLVVSLLLTWWGPPPVFIDPPSDLPAELELIAEDAREHESLPSEATNPYYRDAFAYFQIRDAIWLVTGIGGFALGLSALAGSRMTRPLALVTAVLAIMSAALIAATLISPPDYIEVANNIYQEISDAQPWEIDYDLPFRRQLGGFIGLAAALGVGLGAGLVLRRQRS